MGVAKNRIVSPIFVVLLWGATAQAGSGELALGAAATYVGPAEGVVGPLATVGLHDFVALRGLAQGGYGEDGAALLVAGELVLLFDVIAWVPELSLGGGVRVAEDGSAGLLLASFGVRRYVSMEWSVGAWAGAMLEHDRLRATARLGLARDL